MQKMSSFSLTPIRRIELAPRRGERQKYWIAKNDIVFPIFNFFEIGN